jgi:hypothetical protein
MGLKEPVSEIVFYMMEYEPEKVPITIERFKESQKYFEENAHLFNIQPDEMNHYGFTDPEEVITKIMEEYNEWLKNPKEEDNV